MTQSRNQLVFFTIAFIIVLVLTFLIFWPFMIVLILAGMLAVILQPVHTWVLKQVKGQRSIASLITLLFLVVVIMLPIALITSRIIGEAQTMYTHLATGGDVSLDHITQVVEQYGKKIYPGFTFDTRSYLAVASSWVVSHLGGLFSGTLDIVVKFFLMLVALFYFLRDGETFKKQLKTLSPLNDAEDESLMDNLNSSIKSILVGSVIIAIAQGLLAGIGFAVFGVPNAVLWGTTAGIASLIPGVGTALVWIPATLYLFFAKAGFFWLGELVWSVAIVSTVDNFLSPFILERGIKIHPLLILFSILGGLSFFGPAGFLIGPLVLSLLFALMRVYQKGRNSDLQ